MLKRNKVDVHTFLICIAFMFLLKMCAFDCHIFRNYFQMNIYAYQEYEPFILSPSSIQNVLGVAYLGSNGKTSDEMQYNIELYGNKRTAAFAIKSESIYTVTEVYVSNSLVLAPEFEFVLDVLEAELERIDLTDAQPRIVDWIKKKAPNIHFFFFEGITDTNTTAVVVNLMNVELEWRKPFTMGNTINNISMMHLVGDFLYGEIPKLNAKAVVLPFKSESAKMLLLLPNDDSVHGLVPKLRNININSIIRTLRLRKVDILLPNFDITQNNVLDSALKEMNVSQAFGENANFKSLFSGGEESYIKAVKHTGSIVIGPQKVILQAASILQLKKKSSSSDSEVEQTPIPDSEPVYSADQDFNRELFLILPEKLDFVPGFLAYKSFVYVIVDGDTVLAAGAIRPLIDIPVSSPSDEIIVEPMDR